METEKHQRNRFYDTDREVREYALLWQYVQSDSLQEKKKSERRTIDQPVWHKHLLLGFI